MKSIIKLRTLAFFAPFVVVAFCPTPSRAVEVSLQDCPQAVQDTINANRKGGRIDEIDFLAASGIYDVDINLGRGRDLDLVINASGRLLRSVEDIGLARAPRAVKNSIRRLMQGGGRIDDLDLETAGGRVTYRVDIDFPSGPDLEATISEKGLVLKRNRRD
ncbi:MAG: hypothetical protein JNJ70_26565 [Verrucomicrobiales bacterium]|jgi:uncharacterized membrane protein YkoI|nr:hypothetical protein [Verrucomicrobiales bacterium]